MLLEPWFNRGLDLLDAADGGFDLVALARRQQRAHGACAGRVADGADEVHKATVATAPEAGAEEPTVSVIRRDTEIKAILDDAWDALVADAGQEDSAPEFFAYVQANAGDLGEALLEGGAAPRCIQAWRPSAAT